MNVTINEEALVEFKKKLTPINAGKAIFGTLVSIGAAAAVIAAFRNPLKASSGILKLLMAAGVFVLACKAGDIADEHLKETVDDWTSTAKEISEELKKEEKQTKGADKKNGSDTLHRGNTQQQPEKQGTGSAETGQTSSPTVRRRWWSKKEGNAEVLEVDEKDVSERSESS